MSAPVHNYSGTFASPARASLPNVRPPRRSTGSMKAARPRDHFEPSASSRGLGVLLRGATGAGVREVQRKLMSLGYLTPEAVATGPGVFGPRTEDAVRAFQKRHGLKNTGVVGSYTQAALSAAMVRTTQQAPSVLATATAGLRSASYPSRYDGSAPAPGTQSPPTEAIRPAVTSTPADRSAARYADVINQFAVGTNPRYLRRGTQTFSHVFVGDVTHAMGAPIPREVGGIGLNANGVNGWLKGIGPQHGWRAVDAATALQYANAGAPAIASWRNAQGPGHLAVVRPGGSGPGPTVAQAGARNFNQGLADNGFGASAPEYFVHA